MTGLEVALSWPEVRLAGQIGADRYVRNRAHGRRPLWGQGPDDVDANMVGAWGECVVAKAANVYWLGGPMRPDGGRPDVGPFHVRTTRHTDGCLILHDEDVDGEPYVLVVVDELPRFRVIGWCYGRDGKLPGFWRETERPAYFVPAGELRPFDRSLLALEGLT